MTDTVYVLDIHWKRPNKRRWGYMCVRPNLESAQQRFEDALRIVAETSIDQATNWNVETNDQGDTFTTFEAGGRHWECHLYSEVEGAKKMRKFHQ